MRQSKMEDLIIKALDDTIIKLDKITPTTKKKTKSISIIDVSPLDIPSFMKDNNIPNNAYFNGIDNGYDGWHTDILLSWDIDVPTTGDDKLKFRRNRFTTIAFKSVYDSLTSNGYKRVGYNSGLLRDFNDTTVYDMYLVKDFNRLVKYYSLPFILEMQSE